jgi:hypothetical protein
MAARIGMGERCLIDARLASIGFQWRPREKGRLTTFLTKVVLLQAERH